MSSLVIDGTETIVGPVAADGTARGTLDWGVYPMVPFAGRVRDARFAFDGLSHELTANGGRHALHGTVFESAWSVRDSDATSVVMEVDLGRSWPFPGTVTHSVTLAETSATFGLEVRAAADMPVQVGWHPWFAAPAKLQADFRAWLPRDADGMPGAPTPEGMPRLDTAVDDCFLGDGSPVRVRVRGVELTLTSDCRHWVVYTGAQHGVCAEPQSGPPNEFENAPVTLRSGESFSRWFRISWHA